MAKLYCSAFSFLNIHQPLSQSYQLQNQQCYKSGEFIWAEITPSFMSGEVLKCSLDTNGNNDVVSIMCIASLLLFFSLFEKLVYILVCWLCFPMCLKDRDSYFSVSMCVCTSVQVAASWKSVCSLYIIEKCERNGSHSFRADWKLVAWKLLHCMSHCLIQIKNKGGVYPGRVAVLSDSRLFFTTGHVTSVSSRSLHLLQQLTLTATSSFFHLIKAPSPFSMQSQLVLLLQTFKAFKRLLQP